MKKIITLASILISTSSFALQDLETITCEDLAIYKEMNGISLITSRVLDYIGDDEPIWSQVVFKDHYDFSISDGSGRKARIYDIEQKENTVSFYTHENKRGHRRLGQKYTLTFKGNEVEMTAMSSTRKEGYGRKAVTHFETSYSVTMDDKFVAVYEINKEREEQIKNFKCSN